MTSKQVGGGVVTGEDEEGESVCAKRRWVVVFLWRRDADGCRRWRIKKGRRFVDLGNGRLECQI